MTEKPSHTYLRHLLIPVIRFCLRHSLKLQDLIEIAKQCFIELAKEDLCRDGRKVSSSRLSIMTGVHRRDVTRLKRDLPPPKRGPDLITRIIGQWQNDRRFCSRRKGPKYLSFESTESEFAQLVGAVSREVNPYTVLFELERTGAVRRTRNGLKLCTSLYMPSSKAKEGFRLLGSDIHDLITSVEENVFVKPRVPNLHIKTEYDNIPAHLVPRIKQWMLDEGSSLHERVRSYLSQCDRDLNPGISARGETVRIALGTFSSIENLTHDSPQRAIKQINKLPGRIGPPQKGKDIFQQSHKKA